MALEKTALSKGTIWDFGGQHLKPRELAKLNYEAGFRDHDSLIRSVAVFLAESEGWTRAWHKNFKVPDDPTSPLLSTDFMFPQINDAAHPEIKLLWSMADNRETWAACAKLAHDIFVGNGRSFGPWVANAVADARMLEAINGVCNFEKERHGLPLVH